MYAAIPSTQKTRNNVLQKLKTAKASKKFGILTYKNEWSKISYWVQRSKPIKYVSTGNVNTWSNSSRHHVFRCNSNSSQRKASSTVNSTSRLLAVTAGLRVPPIDHCVPLNADKTAPEEHRIWITTSCFQNIPTETKLSRSVTPAEDRKGWHIMLLSAIEETWGT